MRAFNQADELTKKSIILTSLAQAAASDLKDDKTKLTLHRSLHSMFIAGPYESPTTTIPRRIERAPYRKALFHHIETNTARMLNTPECNR